MEAASETAAAREAAVFSAAPLPQPKKRLLCAVSRLLNISYQPPKESKDALFVPANKPFIGRYILALHEHHQLFVRILTSMFMHNMHG